MQITFVTRKFRNGQRNLHCDLVHITTEWVLCLTLDCNGVFAIKAYGGERACDCSGGNLKMGYIEFKYYADGIHSGLTLPG